MNNILNIAGYYKFLMKIPRPEGFKVEEIPGDYGCGNHTHFTLWKKEWNTLDAIKEIAKYLGVDKDRFGYAGLKDKNAVTTQRVSVWRVPKKRLKKIKIKGIKISNIKEGLEKIRIGSHKGNRFEIILEGVKLKNLKEPKDIPNLFGPQRLQGSEVLGKLLINRDWPGLVNELKKNPKGSYEKKVIAYLKKRPGDHLGGIKQVNKQIRVLWVNAWQAKQWNNRLNTSKEYQLLPSYPAIPEMPELGKFPGSERKTKVTPKGYKVIKVDKGAKLKFALPKGSYATVVIDYLVGP
jgi:tRNA pseudouridine13 synthase